MKKLIFITITLFSILNVFGQNGLNNGHLFLLQKDKKNISINSFENNQINELKSFPISKKSIYTTDQKDRVVIIDTAKNFVSLLNIRTSEKIKLSIPFDIKPKTVLLNENNIFIGGEMGKEILIQYHLKDKKWYQLEIPKEVISYGKAVDDLVINDSLLIAIDNIILPKYVLYYHLSSNEKLRFSHFKELKFNSSYETIHQARITQNYLGLYSTTMNWGTISEHITLYADLDLLKSFAISVDYKEKFNFNDFLLIGNKLYIANSLKGLGVLNIEDSFFKQSVHEFESNSNIDEKLVTYKSFKNEEIIRLTKIPNDEKIILTIKDTKGKFRNEILIE